MRKIIPLSFVFILLTSGCLSVSPEALIASSPIVQDFLADYPNADIKATYYSAAETAGILDEIRADCEKDTVTAKDFYKVTITDTDSGLSLTAWVDWNNQIIECAAKKGTSGDKLESYDKETMEGKKNYEYVYKCYEGHVYKFDKEGNKLDKYQYCENGCADGKCIGEGSGEYAKKCYEGHVYKFDLNGKNLGKVEYCSYGCEEGECIEKVIGECNETDGGWNIYEKGVCEVGDQKLEDHCNDDGSLTEKYCEGKEIKWKSTECPAGYVCKDAACVAAEAEEICESHTYTVCHDGHVYWVDSCGNVQEKKEYCENGCEEGECKASVIPEAELVCCESYGFGAEMVKCCEIYNLTAPEDCAVDVDFVGGGKNIVDDSYCENLT
ncbi:MAG: hypothetical protein JW789_00095 [Candidatus Aenigmarchaeota archaeon]|nr:hypothetical protein [Candidatus Aenigmarchaeota archaeon]